MRVEHGKSKRALDAMLEQLAAPTPEDPRVQHPEDPYDNPFYHKRTHGASWLPTRKTKTARLLTMAALGDLDIHTDPEIGAPRDDLKRHLIEVPDKPSSDPDAPVIATPQPIKACVTTVALSCPVCGSEKTSQPAESEGKVRSTCSECNTQFVL